MTDLPLTVKEHPRARNVLVKLVPGRGLEVVVPKGFDHSRIPDVLDRKRDWIEQTRQSMEADGIELVRDCEPPETIDFQALGHKRSVDYLHKDSSIKVMENGPRLMVSGDLTDRESLFGALRKYVATQAKLHLPPLLAEVSRRTGFTYASVRIRTQKSRWGSCSARGTISLNCKLLFLSPDLVTHLFLHELCHTRHMNHSPAYWTLVASHQPDYLRLEEELKHGNRHVPGWML